jgi:hypothetical protein
MVVVPERKSVPSSCSTCAKDQLACATQSWDQLFVMERYAEVLERCESECSQTLATAPLDPSVIEDARYGLHETFGYYSECRQRQRNLVTFGEYLLLALTHQPSGPIHW